MWVRGLAPSAPCSLLATLAKPLLTQSGPPPCGNLQDEETEGDGKQVSAAKITILPSGPKATLAVQTAIQPLTLDQVRTSWQQQGWQQQ